MHSWDNSWRNGGSFSSLTAHQTEAATTAVTPAMASVFQSNPNVGNTTLISRLSFRSKLSNQPPAASAIVYQTGAAETHGVYPSNLFVFESTPPSINEVLLLVSEVNSEENFERRHPFSGQ
mmetsp:Transcript_21633/g.32212  ORF Transcript_21633/g.32212 Transcript_21633/m.32212 type:complete len:121 (-) Transcript_21633:1166-1528(-)